LCNILSGVEILFVIHDIAFEMYDLLYMLTPAPLMLPHLPEPGKSAVLHYSSTEKQVWKESLRKFK